MAKQSFTNKCTWKIKHFLWLPTILKVTYCKKGTYKIVLLCARIRATSRKGLLYKNDQVSERIHQLIATLVSCHASCCVVFSRPSVLTHSRNFASLTKETLYC